MKHIAVASISLALMASGCDGRPHTFVVRDAALPDASLDPPEDAGPPPRLDDGCGAVPPAFSVSDTRVAIPIDTTSSTDDVQTTCGGALTSGNDAFLTVNAHAGEYWHFQLAIEPSDASSPERSPALYLLSNSCDARDACTFASDLCSADGDEHFGFVAPTSGALYLGIDDRVVGGGRYRLDVVRPVCGDDMRQQGEACDDGNRLSNDGCSPECLEELRAEAPAEIENNDDPFTANYLLLGAENQLTVVGDVGGAGVCRYGDYFALDVPSNATIEVDVIEPDGTVCDDPALTASYRLTLLEVGSLPVVAPMTIDGCAALRSSPLTGGRYYVRVELPSEMDTVVPYRLSVRVVP